MLPDTSRESQNGHRPLVGHIMDGDERVGFAHDGSVFHGELRKKLPELPEGTMAPDYDDLRARAAIIGPKVLIVARTWGVGVHSARSEPDPNHPLDEQPLDYPVLLPTGQFPPGGLPFRPDHHTHPDLPRRFVRYVPLSPQPGDAAPPIDFLRE